MLVDYQNFAGLFESNFVGTVNWNPSYSRGPLFVDCKKFCCWWGCNFVGNWFIVLQTGQFITLLNVRVDVNP